MIKKLFIGITIFFFINKVSYANEFILFQQEGISINIPKNWYFIEKSQIAHIKNIASSLTREKIKSRTILGVNSHLNNHFGQIRLSIFDKGSDESMLIELTPDEIKELKFEFEKDFQKSLSKSGNVMLDFDFTILHKPKIGMLVFYIRNGKNNSYWSVKIYRFLDSKNNRDIMLTLSYDLSKKESIDPVLNNVLQSLTF